MKTQRDSDRTPVTPTVATGSAESSLRPSQDGSLSRSNSGRLLRHVAGLARSNKSIDAPRLENGDSHAVQDGANKTWQLRWTPKLRKSSGSESITAYGPVSSPSLPTLPAASGTISPPPAVKLDDTTFGRPFSTTGITDMNFGPSRFSFLDMSNLDHDSDDDTERNQPTAHSSAILPSSDLHTSPPRITEIVLQPPTPASAQESRYGSRQASTNLDRYSHGFQSLPASSPALASLISSFPSPSSRGNAVTTASSSLLVESEDGEPVEALSDAGHSWDGGETWEVNTNDPVLSSIGQTSLPYLDMGNNTAEDDQNLEFMASQPFSGEGMSPLWAKPTHNPPPGPAPTAALPDLPQPPAIASTENSTFTAESSRGGLDATESALPPLGAHPLHITTHREETPRQLQKPMTIQSLASSSADLLTPASAQAGNLFATSSTARSASPASFVTASQSGSPTNSLVLDPSSSPGQVAKSLDIPRDAIKQMLETTQHVWRSHNVGPNTQNGGLNSSYLPRSRSFPILSSLYTSDAEGSYATESHRSDENRLSVSNITYVSSNRPSFEKDQSPGWAISKSSPEVARTVGPVLSKSDKMRFRQTFLNSATDETQTVSPNFSRPIGRGLTGGEPMGASASMPALSFSGAEPSSQAFLQSPLLLKSEQGCQFPVAHEEEQEILDSGSESHQCTPATEVRSRFREDFDDDDQTPSRSATVLSPKRFLRNRAEESSGKIILPRRNSDTALNRIGLNIGKREPGELHAWSVSVDEKGVPAIRPSPSAFHKPGCTLAGKNNATWQCGCRGTDGGDVVKSSISSVPRFGVSALPDQPSPGRSRSLSASNVVDPRQAKLWDQVEMNKVLIRKHEEEIAGLQEQVFRISSEIASARPSLSSAFNTPEPTQLTRFATPLATDLVTDKPLPAAAETEKELTTTNSTTAGIPTKSAKPVPALPGSAQADAMGAPRSSHSGERVKAHSMKASSSLRDRLAALSRTQLLDRDAPSRPVQSLDLGHSRFTSSSSTHTLGRKFRFPWSSVVENKENISEPTPYPVAKDGPAEAKTSSSSKPLPKLQFAADAKEGRSLPAAPVQDGNAKDKKYPPSARKYNYGSLNGPTTQSSVGPTHLRGQSESSSFGTSTSIFSSEGGEGYESRYGFFPKLNKRWDSISSRGTNASARSSADLGVQASGSSAVKTGMVSSTSTPILPTSAKADDARPVQPSMDLSRRSKTPPPRRSSLRKSKDLAPVRSPIPAAFLQSPSAGMAPISEQSEVGSPSSNRHGSAREDVEMSPVSIVNASITGPGRMSMSDRYNSQGLTVPISLPLSSSQVSLVSSPNLSPRSHMSSQFGGTERKLSIDASPRLNRQPLQMGMSHGSLTISRQHPITS